MKHNPLLWAALILLTLVACGRKTLPAAADAYVPPAVENLTATLTSGEVTLRWVVPDGRRQREKGLSRILVFKAERSASCRGCPLAYQPIASIPTHELTENDRGQLLGSYTFPLQGKGALLFYATARSSLGVEGPKSDVVEVVRPSEDR